MYILFFLIIPIFFAFYAFRTNKYILKTMQTFTCALIVIFVGIFAESEPFWYLSAAFLVSILGDYFLSCKEKNKNYYLYGIALYFLAHVGYLLYIIMSFEIERLIFAIVFGALLAIYLAYFFVSLKKNVSGIMNVAVLFYLVISCVVLALAASALADIWVKIIMIAGIALIVISDTIIAETDFLNRKRFSFLILPTYYAAQILLSASFIILSIAR